MKRWGRFSYVTTNADAPMISGGYFGIKLVMTLNWQLFSRPGLGVVRRQSKLDFALKIGHQFARRK